MAADETNEMRDCAFQGADRGLHDVPGGDGPFGAVQLALCPQNRAASDRNCVRPRMGRLIRAAEPTLQSRPTLRYRAVLHYAKGPQLRPTAAPVPLREKRSKDSLL